MEVKALENEDTLLRTHCCRQKCFPVCPLAQHLLRTQKMIPISFRNILRPQQMFPAQFAQPKKHHEQQCVRNNVSSFAREVNWTTLALERRYFVSYGSLYVSQNVHKRLLHSLFNGSRGFTVGFLLVFARDFAAIRINLHCLMDL